MNLKEIIKQTEESYDKAGRDYYNIFHDELEKHDLDKQILKNFIKSLPAEPIVCDFGCGPAAQYGKFIVPYSKKVYAVDISSQNIKIAEQENPDISFKCENMLETTFPDSCLDGIISFYAIFHIPKEYDYRFFREACRILKPGGRLLVMTHKGDLVQTFNEIWNHNDLQLFANFHTEEELVKSAERADLIVESCFAKKSYYDFPDERILLTARKL